jgi:hypothetical protein
MTRLAEACEEMAAALPRAAALIAVPDTDGTTAGGKPGSRPPWNAAAAMALLDVHEGLRRLEPAMRLAVTGHPGRRRGGSDVNTWKALDAIEALGDGMSADAAAMAARILARWANAIMMLPAVDEAERPQRVQSACPYCGFPMLRVFARSGRVACLRFGSCFDSDGQHPTGRLEVSQIDGSPCVIWADGLVT